MKKTTLFLTLLIFSVCFLSCSKDEESTFEQELVGTKWIALDWYYTDVYEGACYEIYEFISATNVKLYVTKNGEVVKDALGSQTCTYVLTYPYIAIYYPNTGKTDNFLFTDSRTMIRDGYESGDLSGKYLKQ